MPVPTTEELSALMSGRTYEDMAKLAGVAPHTWAKWAVGLRPMPARIWAKLQPKPEPIPSPASEPPMVAPTTSTVRAKRDEYGCARYQIANLAGVRADTWGAWESTKPPSASKWAKVLATLETKPKLIKEPKLKPSPTPKPDEPVANPRDIKVFREAALMNRQQAATLAGVSVDTWKSWELGRRPMTQAKLDEWAAKATELANAPTPSAAAYVAPEPKLYFRPQGDNAPTELPGITVVGDDMTPEQEAEMERDLMTPVMYDPRNPKSVQDALKAELGDQEALRKAAQRRALELVARDQKRLEED